MENALEAGQQLVSSVSADKEANLAAKEAIMALIPEIKANIEAYRKLDNFYNDELGVVLDELKDNQLFSEFYTFLSELSDNISEYALGEYLWTTQQIEEAIASVPVEYKKAVQKAFETIQAGGYTGDDLDITPILEGLSYTYSENAVTGNNIPDKEWTSDAGDSFKTQYGTAEVWNKSPFKVTRTLKDMPAGTYTITTRAFYRTIDNDTNYDIYNSDDKKDLAYVWAGYSKTPLCNVAELAGLDKNIGSKLTNELTIPNNQKEANYVFTNEQFDLYTVKSVKTVLAETGDLSFGICSDEMSKDSWVVWYSFEIDYNTLDEDLLVKELAGFIDEVDKFAGDENNIGSEVAKNSLMSAVSAAYDAVDHCTGLVEASSKLAKEFASFKENVAAYKEMFTALDALADAIDTYSSTAEGVARDNATILHGEIDEKLGGRSYTTEQISALLAEVRAAIRELKFPAGMSTATDTDPVPCTSLIENPSFETGDFTGWTYNSAATGDTKIVGAADEKYVVENAEGNYLFNTWNASPVDFYVTQTVADLKPGTYELTALVASDKGNKITISVNNDAVETEMLEEKNIGTDVSVIFAVAEGESAVIKVSSASWFKADNFRLRYFGTNSTQTPTAVEEVATDASASAIFNVAGVRQNALKKGINIVKNGNTVKKIYVK